mgnify:CR=1 FL=1
MWRPVNRPVFMFNNLGTLHLIGRSFWLLARAPLQHSGRTVFVSNWVRKGFQSFALITEIRANPRILIIPIGLKNFKESSRTKTVSFILNSSIFRSGSNRFDRNLKRLWYSFKIKGCPALLQQPAAIRIFLCRPVRIPARSQWQIQDRSFSRRFWLQKIAWKVLNMACKKCISCI